MILIDTQVDGEFSSICPCIADSYQQNYVFRVHNDYKPQSFDAIRIACFEIDFLKFGITYTLIPPRIEECI